MTNSDRFAPFLASLTKEQALAWHHSKEQHLFTTDLLTTNNFARSTYAIDCAENVFARLLGFEDRNDYDAFPAKKAFIG